MSGHKENIAEFCDLFVNLPRENQIELLNRLSDTGAPPEWLDLLARHIMRKPE
jgi:hypothetical protein